MTDFPEIPGYKILSVLGEGGVAKVYLAIQEKLDRKVAIKVLEPSLLKSEVTAVRFEKEAKTAARLSHSNIIQIFDTGKAGNYYYIVMEYLEESLKDRMKLNPYGEMDQEMALDIIGEIFKALDYAHFKGVFHRDIKPDNIMFRQDNTLVVVDFGIARVFDSPDQQTKTGIGVGTIYYMSPEQCKNQEVDGRSDIYSLGVILFEMLTGKRPYIGETHISVALQHAGNSVPVLPQELRRYQPLINKMMAKDRDNRLSSGVEFAKLLDTIKINPKDSTPRTVESIPSPPKTIPRDFSFKLPPRDMKSISSDLMDIVKKKVKLFIENMKETFGSFREGKLGPFIKYMNDNLDSLKSYPFRKKVGIGAIGVVLLVMIIVVFFNSGPKKESYITSFFKYLGKKVSTCYQYNLKLAYNLSEKKNLESLKKGLELVKVLKKINTNKELIALELIALEGKFTGRIEQLETEFNKYYKEADEYFKKGNYLKAKESILMAKKIKVTKGLKLFEENIDIKVYQDQKRKKFEGQEVKR